MASINFSLSLHDHQDGEQFVAETQPNDSSQSIVSNTKYPIGIGDHHSQTINRRKRRRSPENNENRFTPSKRRRLSIYVKPRYIKPVGLVRSKRSSPNVTAPFQNALDLLREEESIPSPANEPSSCEATPILSQSTVESEPDHDLTPRRFRKSLPINDDSDTKVSACCNISVLMEQKQRYLQVYEARIRRIYRKYNRNNCDIIHHWLNTFGGDPAKLHGLYVKICGKYEVTPHGIYEGYAPHDIANESMEKSKHFMMKPIPIRVNDGNTDALPTIDAVEEQGLNPSLNTESLEGNENCNVNSDDPSDISSASTFASHPPSNNAANAIEFNSKPRVFKVPDKSTTTIQLQSDTNPSGSIIMTDSNPHQCPMNENHNYLNTNDRFEFKTNVIIKDDGSFFKMC
eukprot:479460_1